MTFALGINQHLAMLLSRQGSLMVEFETVLGEKQHLHDEIQPIDRVWYMKLFGSLHYVQSLQQCKG